MVTNEQLKKIVLDFLEKSGISASSFGKQAKNDPNLVFRIVAGQEVKEEGKERILNFINSYEEK